MRAFRIALAALGLYACGAKTGLRLPDVGIDAQDVSPDVQDAPDVREACMPGTFALERRRAEVMLLIDRSNSMGLDLEGEAPRPGEPTRWRVLRDALALALPPFQSELRMGAIAFPRAGRRRHGVCSASARVDLAPAQDNADEIVSILRTTEPNGGTPTFEALRLADQYFSANPARGASRSIVLATDGGPNCNFGLDPSSCQCTSRDDTGQPNCGPPNSLNYNCLDDERTLRAIGQLARLRQIPVYVIGIPNRSQPELSDVLNRMAVEGGRPRNDPNERFYSVRRPADLTSAFETIQREIARCAFVTPSVPDDPDEITVTFDGVPLSRDPLHQDGWDWTDAGFGELTLFGPACERAVTQPSGVLRARVGCGDGG